MATTHTHSNHPGALYSIAVAGLAAAAVALSFSLSPQRQCSPPAPTPLPGGPATTAQLGGDDGLELGFMGFAGRPVDSKKPKLTAYFLRESYAPGEAARLVVTDNAPAVTVQVFQAGTESTPTLSSDVMLGSPVGSRLSIGSVHGRATVAVDIGDWPSGVYFAKLVSGKRVGYAPFVLRPRRLGEHEVAVVMPTETWQAYNWRDDDGDGYGDTWYAGWRTSRALLVRPFLNRGVPPHWKHYDAPFLCWLQRTGRKVDYLSDAELRAVGSGRELAAAYGLIVFPGHHEYVTTHEYDVVERYRDLGGNLAFLSANNFFWKITLDGSVMTRIAQWRDLGRPEAALIGVQYRANDDGSHRAPWLLRQVAAAPWLFAGTGLRNGAAFSTGGIEIDRTFPSSPRGTQVIAEIPNLFGPGFTGQMSYYETKAGARVFAAGAFSLAGSVWNETEATLVGNLWSHLTSD